MFDAETPVQDDIKPYICYTIDDKPVRVIVMKLSAASSGVTSGPVLERKSTSICIATGGHVTAGIPCHCVNIPVCICPQQSLTFL